MVVLSLESKVDLVRLLWFQVLGLVVFTIREVVILRSLVFFIPFILSIMSLVLRYMLSLFAESVLASCTFWAVNGFVSSVFDTAF